MKNIIVKIKEFFKPSPIFISFDGPERTGKSTQIRLLKKYFISKGYKVLVLHSSILDKRDVTKFKVSKDVKFFAYLASLWYAALKAVNSFNKKQADYVIFDRFILTHLAYSVAYYNKDLIPFNRYFVKLCLKLLGKNLYNICLLGPITTKRDQKLENAFKQCCFSLPNTFWIENTGLSKEEINFKIRDILNL